MRSQLTICFSDNCIEKTFFFLYRNDKSEFQKLVYKNHVETADWDICLYKFFFNN